MLSQFQARYPTGSLISELLQIYQGKFVVRVAATVEGVTRATGMAAAETLELAEDRARSRALAVLGIKQSPSTQEADAGKMFFPEDSKASDPPQPTTSEIQLQPASTVSSPLKVMQANQDIPLTTTGGSFNDLFENLGIMSGTQKESSEEPKGAWGSGEMDMGTEGSLRQNATPGEIGLEASEPVDLSDAIARTGVELERLGWSNRQGREYLERTYNKRSRQHLTDQEMLEFLAYLESQPSPTEPPFAKGSSL